MVSSLASLAQTGAHGSWETAPLETWRVIGGAAVALLVLFWIGRALLGMQRYRALAVIGESERERVRAAVAQAEKHTSGELVVVVLERSDAHVLARVLAGTCFALLFGMGAVLVFESTPPLFILGVLAAGWVAGFALAQFLPALARGFTSEAQATRAAAEQALVEFQTQELHETQERTGVLVFVSLYERRAIVLGDKGIHAKVGDAHWARARDLLLDGAAQARLCNGLVAAVEECGRVLAEHFPPRADDTNELPDRLVVRRE
jgi:putative membrane protein